MSLKNKILIIFFLLVGLYCFLMPLKFSYFDIYKLSLNGKIEKITITVKENMFIVVLNKEHDIAHFWPVLQKRVEVGDSVYKKSKEYDIILVKRSTKERIVCHYKENE